jgi:hypothetical protein
VNLFDENHLANCAWSDSWRVGVRGAGCVGKLTEPKINLIMQHKTKNSDLLTDNIHVIRTEQIWTISTRLTHKRRIDNESNHKTVITTNWNCRFTHGDFHEFCRETRADVCEALPRNLIRRHPCRLSKRRRWFGDTALPWSATRQTKGRQDREAVAQRIEKKMMSRLLFAYVLRLKDVCPL